MREKVEDINRAHVQSQMYMVDLQGQLRGDGELRCFLFYVV
jgi:hypothetical protein